MFIDCESHFRYKGLSQPAGQYSYITTTKCSMFFVCVCDNGGSDDDGNYVMTMCDEFDVRE